MARAFEFNGQFYTSDQISKVIKYISNEFSKHMNSKVDTIDYSKDELTIKSYYTFSIYPLDENGKKLPVGFADVGGFEISLDFMNDEYYIYHKIKTSVDRSDYSGADNKNIDYYEPCKILYESSNNINKSVQQLEDFENILKEISSKITQIVDETKVLFYETSYSYDTSSFADYVNVSDIITNLNSILDKCYYFNIDKIIEHINE